MLDAPAIVHDFLECADAHFEVVFHVIVCYLVVALAGLYARRHHRLVGYGVVLVMTAALKLGARMS